MSVAFAPVPPPPEPWDNTEEYQDNISECSDEYEEVSCVSSDTEDTESDISIDDMLPRFRMRNKKTVAAPSPYYKNILQEENYFSE